ncbi:tbc1 domain family member 30 [Lasius niger]|uniref:Tbc1 domain family member 30 n=1 Tax=Lasius niger TaxID=67767 RepID=A0A0J7KJX9_LASNI|nr:tbc1 domain family member 30 [Lasius niger]
MITSYNVTPLRKYAEISYRVKCIAVENERVFGDVYVTQQTLDRVCQPDNYAFPSEHRRRNLIQRTLDGPDFMKLNSKQPTGSAGVARSYWRRRSKSTADEPSMITFNYENADNRDTIAKRPKVNVRRKEHVQYIVCDYILDIPATSALFAAAERNCDYLTSGSTIVGHLWHSDGRQGTFRKRINGIVLETTPATSISAESSSAIEK